MEPNLLIPQYSNIESLLGISKSVIKVFTLKTSHAPFVIVLYSTVALDLAIIFCLLLLHSNFPWEIYKLQLVSYCCIWSCTHILFLASLGYQNSMDKCTNYNNRRWTTDLFDACLIRFDEHSHPDDNALAIIPHSFMERIEYLKIQLTSEWLAHNFKNIWNILPG